MSQLRVFGTGSAHSKGSLKLIDEVVAEKDMMVNLEKSEAIQSVMHTFHKAGVMFMLLVMALVVSGANAAETTPSVTLGKAVLPRLVDLGAGRCIPCMKMAPILEQLRADYAGKLDVVFIDVWKSPEAATPYHIRAIPTQVFYGKDGRELFRHEGFYSREQILGKWRELGFPLVDKNQRP